MASIRSVRFLALSSIALAAMLICGNAIAGTSHPNPDSPGTDSKPSHNTHNPGHIWLSIAAGHEGAVTSGGFAHDNCTGGYYTLSSCTVASMSGGDYSMDIGGSDDARLKIDYAGYDVGGTITPNPNYNIELSAVPYQTGTWSSGSPACNWRSYQIYISYYDMSSVYHYSAIGWVGFGHLENWQISGTVHANAIRSNPAGSGAILYLNDINVGHPYAGTGPCSYGQHVHIQVSSWHDYGAMYEWHGEGPDYYYYGHVHCGNPSQGYGVSGCPSGYGQDYAYYSYLIGFIGGGTQTTAAMKPNPYVTGH